MQFFIVVTARFIIPYFHVASGTEMILSLQVAVLGANGESRSDGNVGQVIIFQNGFDQLAARPGVADSFSHIEMENRSAGVFGLQFILEAPALQKRRRYVPPESGRGWCNKALPACRLGLCRGKLSGPLWQNGKWRLRPAWLQDCKDCRFPPVFP